MLDGYIIGFHGFRGRGVSLEKPTGTTRIVVIGDSISFAGPLREEERFTELLEQRLREQGREVEVLNLGVGGYDTPNEVVFLEQVGRKSSDLDETARRKLNSYPWPGNIRELRNVIERALIVRPEGRISLHDIHLGAGLGSPAGSEPVEAPENNLNLEGMEKRLILKAIDQAGGNKSEAARLLGITRRALYGRLERYGIK